MKEKERCLDMQCAQCVGIGCAERQIDMENGTVNPIFVIIAMVMTTTVMTFQKDVPHVAALIQTAKIAVICLTTKESGRLILNLNVAPGRWSFAPVDAGRRDCTSPM